MNTETNNPSTRNELTKEVASLFESLKHINEDGVEYWSARELYPHLGYTQWRRFEDAIERAKESCKSASQPIEEHFAGAGKTYSMPNGGSNEMKDVLLTRYACYLVAQNGDPRKTEIAQAQTYFAIQTRYAEIQQTEAYQALTSEERKASFYEKNFANTIQSWQMRLIMPVLSRPLIMPFSRTLATVASTTV